MRAEVRELGFAGETISVEVVDRQASVVFLDEHERRAVDDRGIRAEAGRDRLDEMRLAGAERADQGDDGAGEQRVCDRLTESGGVVEVMEGEVHRAATVNHAAIVYVSRG